MNCGGGSMLSPSDNETTVKMTGSVALALPSAFLRLQSDHFSNKAVYSSCACVAFMPFDKHIVTMSFSLYLLLCRS